MEPSLRRAAIAFILSTAKDLRERNAEMKRGFFAMHRMTDLFSFVLLFCLVVSSSGNESLHSDNHLFQ